MKTIHVDDADTTISELLSRIEPGDEVVIARDGEPVARLIAFPPAICRTPGVLRAYPGWDNFVFDPTVFAPMTEQEMEADGWPT